MLRNMKTNFGSEERSAFTLTELMIVVAIIGLLSAIAVPSFAHSRDSGRLNMIYTNLRTLDSAKDQWALDSNKASGYLVPDVTVLSNYFRWGSLHPVMGETYVANAIGTPCEADLPSGVGLGPFGPGAAIPAP